MVDFKKLTQVSKKTEEIIEFVIATDELTVCRNDSNKPYLIVLDNEETVNMAKEMAQKRKLSLVNTTEESVFVNLARGVSIIIPGVGELDELENPKREVVMITFAKKETGERSPFAKITALKLLCCSLGIEIDELLEEEELE